MSEKKTSREFVTTGFWLGRTKDTVRVLDKPNLPNEGLATKVKRVFGVRRTGK